MLLSDSREKAMKTRYKVALCIKSAVMMVLVASSASAQTSTTANGPYYATPSWDQKLTTNRFVVLANWNNEAVLDRETGLVWDRSPSTETVTQFIAVVKCIQLMRGGRSGWRLPGIQELQSLVDPSAQASPGLPAGHPFTNIVANALYWSLTTGIKEGFFGDSVYVTRFDPDGGVGLINKTTPPHNYWCVRGGQGPDFQLGLQ